MRQLASALAVSSALLLLSATAGAAHPEHARVAAAGYQPMRATGSQPPVKARLLTMAQGQGNDGRGHATLLGIMPHDTQAMQVAGLAGTRVRVVQHPTIEDPAPGNAARNYMTPGLHTKLKFSTTAGGEDELQVQFPVSFHHHQDGDKYAAENTYALSLTTHVGTAAQTTHQLTGIPSAGRITPVALKGHFGGAIELTMHPEKSGGLMGYLNGRKATGERE